jgi:hypothetical protein
VCVESCSQQVLFHDTPQVQQACITSAINESVKVQEDLSALNSKVSALEKQKMEVQIDQCVFLQSCFNKLDEQVEKVYKQPRMSQIEFKPKESPCGLSLKESIVIDLKKTGYVSSKVCDTPL